ncbi:MAG: hypothetical protein EAZ37_14650 [Burkholderiales bacterium]|nr:MAG: hypothetical protein EAZ37_14650 [Burkholderiales bacterium]
MKTFFSSLDRRGLSNAAVIAAVTLLLSGQALATFSNGTGIAVIPGSGFGWGIALQPDGKVLAAGPCGSTHCVARLNADGTLDTTFDATGPTPGRVAISGLFSETGRGTVKLLVRTDGKIVFGGTCRATASINDPSRFCIARLNSNGTLDTTFIGPNATSGAGRFVVPITASSNDLLMGMTIEANNNQKLVLVGECGQTYHCVARLNDDGTFDQGFSGPGAAIAGPGNPVGPGRDVFLHLLGSGQGSARAVTTQPNGKIIIIGKCIDFLQRDYLCMTKLNQDGGLDTDFNGDDTAPGINPGRIAIAIDNTDEVGLDVAMQPDGRFVVLCLHGYFDTCVYRFEEGGKLDKNFSSGRPFPSKPGRTVFSAVKVPIAVALTPSGSSVNNRVLALGKYNKNVVVGFHIGALLNESGGQSDGIIDTGLIGPNGNGEGEVSYDAWFGGGNDSFVNPAGIAAQSDGSFFVVSTCNSQMCVYKFRTDGALDTSPCRADVDGDTRISAASDGVGLIRAMLALPGAPVIPAGTGYDIDGDGVLSASRDGLLFARRMLGFKGSALVRGMSFASSAVRTDPTDIELYLKNRCNVQ